MAHFHHGIASDSIIQGSWNPCLYASTNPYSLYASSARLSRYGVSNEGFPHYADGNSGVSSSLFNGNVWYPNNSHLQTLGHAYESNCVPSVSMATITPGQQSFGEVATSLTALQMANDFAGFSEASNVAKCYKPAHPFYWRKRGNSVPAEGMTRTKDKYRVVYTEKQRIGLEKAFKDNKFITMKEKNVLSKDLDLSERQIKIWFQNRRAKERRQRRNAEVEQEDHVINEEQENDSPDSPDSGDVSTFLNARTYVTQLSPGNYTEAPSFDDATKSQCRYQQNASCVSATSPVFYQRQTQNFSTSPTDWSQRGLSLTKCDVSPFAANPDLMYRS